MGRVQFKLAILDEFGYPISRYDLEVDGELDETSILKAIEKNINEITIVMRAVENEGKQ